jgi:hypothetical protein
MQLAGQVKYSGICMGEACQIRVCAQQAHVSMAQAVTVSPSRRQASGLRSFFLHSMKATRCFEQRTARCFEMLISTAEVGGGVSPSDAIAQRWTTPSRCVPRSHSSYRHIMLTSAMQAARMWGSITNVARM